MVGYVLQRRRDRLRRLRHRPRSGRSRHPAGDRADDLRAPGDGLFKTLPGLILVEVAFLLPFSVLIFRTFVSAIPRELDEAAIMDGAGPVRLFLRVIFPLLRPAIITVIVVGVGGVYNDFVNPLYFLPGNDNVTVQLTLFNFQSQFSTALEPALRRCPADHDPAPDHVHLLPAADRVGHDGRRRQGLGELVSESRGGTIRPMTPDGSRGPGFMSQRSEPGAGGVPGDRGGAGAADVATRAPHDRRRPVGI